MYTCVTDVDIFGHLRAILKSNFVIELEDSSKKQQERLKNYHWDFCRFEEEYLRATKEAEKIEAVLGGLTKKNQAQVRQHFCLSICSYFG